MAKMKVLCFHPALAPYRVDFFNLLAEQTDLTVVFLMDNLVNQKLDQNSLRAQAKFSWFLLTRGFDIKGRSIRFGLTRLIRKKRPDVILSYEASPITLFLCLLHSFAGWKLWTSMDEAACALKEIRPDLKVAVVPIIHDTAAIRCHEGNVFAAGQVWRKTLPTSWKKILIFVGRLTKVKNLQWLVTQVKEATWPHGVGLVLVGDGDERSVLEKLISEMAIEDRAILTGQKQGDELYALMSAADALVLPSTFEPYGAVVAEALQWGTPCIVRSTCGCKELLRIDNGGVYDKDSDFVSVLNRVLLLRHGTGSLLPVELQQAVKYFVEAMI